MRIELLGSEPGAPDGQWEDVVEVSAVVPDGSAPRWCSWADEEWGDLALAAGTYRVRVSAEGRDAGADNEFADRVVDAYLVEFWPVPRRPDEILRVGSENARYWHGEIGGRRQGQPAVV